MTGFSKKQDYSHRSVLALASPMILSSLSIPLLGAVDTAVMGHLDSPHYLAAVAVGSVVFGFIYMGFNFLRMGTTGLVAQAYGQNDYTESRTLLTQAILVSLFFAFLILLLQKPISLSLDWIQASKSVNEIANSYFIWRIWSAPAVLINFVLIGWFLGMQNPQGPLFILLVTNTVNIILDIVFVTQFGMHVEGVALASVIAEFCGLIVGLAYLRKVIRNYPGTWQVEQIFSVDKIKRFFTINLHILIRTFSLMFSFAFFTAQGAKFGDKILAANALLLNFQTFTAYGLDGFAHAAEALVGRAVGEKNNSALQRAIKLCFQWAGGVAIAFSLIYFIFGQSLIGLLTNIEDIRNIANQYLLWLVLSPIISIWCFVYDGIFIGATRSKEMMLNMLIATFLVFVPVVFALKQFGNHGLWAALLIFLGARAIFLHRDRAKLFILR